MDWRRKTCALLAALVLISNTHSAGADSAWTPLIAQLSATAPHANPAVIDLAAHALACAEQSSLVRNPHVLSVIDYSLPSTRRRLWVFDLQQRRLLFRELVAHGRNTGANMALHFSNAPDSRMSSIGVFLTGETYTGHNGYSLRLQGLDAGFNDNAMQRDIVIHGAAYVNSRLASSEGRIGRSFGCPAVRPAIAHRLIDTIRDGSLIVAYYPNRSWLRGSTFFNGCADPPNLAGDFRAAAFRAADSAPSTGQTPAPRDSAGTRHRTARRGR